MCIRDRLSYMQAKLPVLCVTDKNTDVGKIAVENGFGWWCESNNLEKTKKIFNNIINSDLSLMGQNAYEYLVEYYSAFQSYCTIIKHFKEKEWFIF